MIARSTFSSERSERINSTFETPLPNRASSETQKSPWFSGTGRHTEIDRFTPSEGSPINAWSQPSQRNRDVNNEPEENEQPKPTDNSNGDWTGGETISGSEVRRVSELTPPSNTSEPLPSSEKGNTLEENTPSTPPKPSSVNQTEKPNTTGKVPTKKVGGQTGMASWYGPGFHGKRTANGETFNQNSMTAAHPSLPFGTKVTVTNTKTGQSAVVRINDRGPFSGGRIIDLSAAAAQAVGIKQSGVGQVKLS
jgi:rare lipoprotein A (peptidoglycan hydrolase)